MTYLNVRSSVADTSPRTALVAHFAGQRRQRLHLTDSGAGALAAHDWPGNLRELRNLVEVADLIVRSAQSRHESRGLHFTTDYPELGDITLDTMLYPSRN
jgi:aspartate oxidase